MGADQPRNGFVEPEPPAGVIRSATLHADRAACLGLPPLSRCLSEAKITVRRYDPGAAEPLPAGGAELTFTAVDVEAWATAALDLIDRALAPERVTVARTLEGSARPLARLENARATLAAAISATAVPILAQDTDTTDRGAASAAFEQALRSGLGARREAVAVIQLPTTAVATGGLHSRPGTDDVVGATPVGPDAASRTLDMVVGATDPERRRLLSLALDVAVTGDAAATSGPRVLALGPLRLPVEVPVALRALPEPPRAVVAAEPSASADTDPTVAELATWTAVTTFAAPAADQDELGIRVGWNVRAADPTSTSAAAEDGARPSVRAAGTDLLAALADLVTNQPAIDADLDLLVPKPNVDPDPADPSATDPGDSAVLNPPPVPAADDPPALDPVARALSALTAVGSLAERMAAGWGPVATDDLRVDVDLETQAVTEFELTVVNRTAPDGTRTVEAFVLRRVSGTVWGPQDRRPRLGHGPDGAAPTVLDAAPSGDDPDVLRYVPSPDLAPGDAPWTIALVYPGLHVVTTQNARAAARTIRNRALTEGRRTNAAFVMRSPETATEVAVPGLVHEAPVAIGRGRMTDYPAALDTAFADLLGADPTGRYRAALTLTYVYRTADSRTADSGTVGSGTGGPAVDVVLPIAMLPDVDDLVGVPDQLAATASTWLAEQAPEGAVDPRLSVELRVFPPATERAAPLLTLSRLDYVLTS